MTDIPPIPIIVIHDLHDRPVHYWLLGDTRRGWRPKRGDRARLVESTSPQYGDAEVGDIVLVSESSAAAGSETQGVYLKHDTHYSTSGHWEHVERVELHVPSGMPLERLTPADRVRALAAVVRQLPPAEREHLSELVARWQAAEEAPGDQRASESQ